MPVMYTILLNFEACKILFFNVLKDVSNAHQGCFYLIKNTVKTVILWNHKP